MPLVTVTTLYSPAKPAVVMVSGEPVQVGTKVVVGHCPFPAVKHWPKLVLLNNENTKTERR